MASEASKDLPSRPGGEAKSANNINKSLPDFIIERNELFEKLWQEQLEEQKTRQHPDINVTIDIGDGSPSTIIAKAGLSTPGSFLKDVPKELSANVVIAKLDNKELWDLNRPLEKDCTVYYILFDSQEGREVFWHSSAHCLGEACEHEYNCLLSHGPPTAQGFFYDMAIPDG